MSAKADIEDALWRLARMMYERDPAMADEFVTDALLVGSEPGEIARGREAIRALLEPIHARPERVTWQWDSIDIAAQGEVGWLFAEGNFVMEAVAGAVRLPYRLAAVLQLLDGVWRWRLFHGSEPKV